MSEEMIDTVFCKKYQKDLPAMKVPPLPGPQGKELMETVSQKAFDAWKDHQTTLINERRLDLSIAENRKFLVDEMLKYFDNKEVAQAEGYVAPATIDPVQQFVPQPPDDTTSIID